MCRQFCAQVRANETKDELLNSSMLGISDSQPVMLCFDLVMLKQKMCRQLARQAIMGQPHDLVVEIGCCLF